MNKLLVIGLMREKLKMRWKKQCLLRPNVEECNDWESLLRVNACRNVRGNEHKANYSTCKE